MQLFIPDLPFSPVPVLSIVFIVLGVLCARWPYVSRVFEALFALTILWMLALIAIGGFQALCGIFQRLFA